MKVICKRNQYPMLRNKTPLTIGKSYDINKREVISSSGVYIRVLCDDGSERKYSDTWFLSKDEMREKIINEILNESSL
jgi:hypothetical protein